MNTTVVPRLFGGTFQVVHDTDSDREGSGSREAEDISRFKLRTRHASIEELIMGLRLLRLICLLWRSGRETSGVHNGVELMICLLEQDRKKIKMIVTREQARQLSAEASETLLTLCLDSKMNITVRHRLCIVWIKCAFKRCNIFRFVSLLSNELESSFAGISEKTRRCAPFATLPKWQHALK